MKYILGLLLLYTCILNAQAQELNNDILLSRKNDHYISKASPVGSHYTTALDLFHFSEAFQDHKLIKKETYDLIKTPWTKGQNTHIGYGMDVDQRNSELILRHSGGWFGVRCELMIFPHSDYIIVVLSNKDGNEAIGASKVIDDLRQMISVKN